MTGRTWLSGFCGLDMPTDSHDRCKVVAEGGLECSCSCHTPTDEVADPVTLPEPVQIGVPGFHVDIPEEDYHRDPTSLSHSGAKTLLKAPALFRYEQQHPPPFKRVFEFGSAAHGKVLGVGAEIRTIPDDILAANGAASTGEAKAFIAKARAEGAVALKAAEVQQIDDMADRLASHRLAMALLGEGQPEVSAYAPDPETGIMLRCRYDWLGASVLTDYKTTTSANPDDWAGAYGFLRKYGYDLQYVWYRDIAEALGHPAQDFVFIAQEKEPPYLVSVITIREADLEDARARKRRALTTYSACVESDAWPGYLDDDDLAVCSTAIQHWDLAS